MHSRTKIDPLFPGSKTFGKVLDELFGQSINDVVKTNFTLKTPAVNIIETTSAFVLEFAAPGLNKKDFGIVVEKNQLIISAKQENETSDETDNFRRREFRYSNFKRSFTLPDTVNKEDIKASYENGVLKVTVSKKEPEAEMKRNIEID